MDLSTLPKIDKGLCKCVPGHCGAPMEYWITYKTDPKDCLVMLANHLWRPICKVEQAVAQGWSA